jgi:hypothetical protein
MTSQANQNFQTGLAGYAYHIVEKRHDTDICIGRDSATTYGQEAEPAEREESSYIAGAGGRSQKVRKSPTDLSKTHANIMPDSKKRKPRGRP